MKRIIFFILFLVSFSNLFAALPLSCSANGLNVLYINGVNVAQEDNKTSANIVAQVIDPIEADFDSNPKHIKSIVGVWNTSRGLLQDIEELKAQLASNHNGQARLDYWKETAKSSLLKTYAVGVGDHVAQAKYEAEKKKIEDAIAQVVSKPKFVFKPDGSIDQDAYSQSDLYKDMVKYNSTLANLLANAASDLAVVEQLKIKIKEAYANGSNKLIVVAHSQGNEVLYSAIKDLRSDNTFLPTSEELSKFDGLIGYMQVAPPSPKLVTDTNLNPGPLDKNHARYIRHNRDLVIGMSNAMTGVMPIVANYTAEIGKSQETFPNDPTGITKLIDNYLNTYANKGITALYHGMDDVYLSSTYFATRDNTATNKALVEHFKDNLREIASNLQDNCNTPVIDLKTADATIDVNGVYKIPGYAETNREILLTLKDGQWLPLFIKR